MSYAQLVVGSDERDCEATETHAYFNATFTEVYKDLAYAHKRSSREQSRLSAVQRIDSAWSPSNIFEHLDLSEGAAERRDDASSDPPNKTIPSCLVDIPSDTKEVLTRPAIEGDLLDDLASVHTYLVVRS